MPWAELARHLHGRADIEAAGRTDAEPFLMQKKKSLAHACVQSA